MGVGSRAGRNAVEAALAEGLDRGQRRRGPLPAHHLRATLARLVHQRYALTHQRVGGRGLDDGGREAGRHHRIEGVAPGQQHAHAGHGHQRMAGGDDALGAGHDRPGRRPVGGVVLDLVDARGGSAHCGSIP